MLLCSIIIPLYNKEKYIQTAINSILIQSYQNFEIIVIDDGSKDGSAELVRQIQDPRITLISQTNRGVSATRNKGIERSTGDIIFFLDGDDWYHTRYLETVVAMANQFPDDTFFATDFKDTLEYRENEWNTIPESELRFELINDFYRRWQRNGNFFCTNTVAVRRKDLIKLQPCFPVGESMGEDQDLWFKLSENLKLVYCPAKLAAYRQQVAGSLCASNGVDVLLPVFRRLEQRARHGMIPGELRDSALMLVAYQRISVARVLLSQGRRFSALTQLFTGIRGAALKRWWSTLAISCVGTPAMMQNWEKLRNKRVIE